MKKSVVIIHPFEKGIVEKFGKFQRILDSGLTIILPFAENVYHVDLRESVIDVAPQDVITKDNANIQVDTIIYFKVTDPFKVMYNVAMFEDAVSNLAKTNLRNIIGLMSVDEVLNARDVINMKLRQSLDEITDRWGVRITRVELQNVIPPEDIKDAMGRQLRAERLKRATILEAEGFRKSEVIRARGLRDAEILMAEGKSAAIKLNAGAERKKKSLIARGESKAIETVFNAYHKADASPEIIKLKYLKALEKMADGKNTKMFMPFDTNKFSGIGKKMIKKKKEPTDEI